MQAKGNVKLVNSVLEKFVAVEYQKKSDAKSKIATMMEQIYALTSWRIMMNNQDVIGCFVYRKKCSSKQGFL